MVQSEDAIFNNIYAEIDDFLGGIVAGTSDSMLLRRFTERWKARFGDEHGPQGVAMATRLFTISRARCTDDDGGSHLSSEKPTVCIITALAHEFAAVNHLLANSRAHQVSGAGAVGRYQIGEVPGAFGGTHQVALALLPDMGNNIAAAQAISVLSHLQVSTVIMTGIAGGIPHPGDHNHHVRLGDIVVSNRHGVIQYDFVKRERDGEVFEEIRSPPRPPSASLLGAVRYLEGMSFRAEKPWDTFLNRIVEGLGFNRPDEKEDVLHHSEMRDQVVDHPKDSLRVSGRPRLFHGPIAASNTLLKDPLKRDELRNRFKAKAVEMEGAGVADAMWLGEGGYLVVRGICDYCDMSKGDSWQRYAAASAAAYTVALIASMPIAG